MLFKRSIGIALFLVILGTMCHLLITPNSPSTVADIHIQIGDSKHQVLSVTLYHGKAPETVKNFIRYVNADFYTDTIFHRIIPHFMAQGGGFTSSLEKKPVQAPIKNEASKELSNHYGTLAMARTSSPHSTTSQFFINLANNSHLNHRQKTQSSYGYAVFGKILQTKNNQNILNQLNRIQTQSVGIHQTLPITQVKIKKIILKTPSVLF